MRDIVIPIFNTDISFNTPQKINRTLFQINSYKEVEIIPNKVTTINAGFYFKDFYYEIIPSDYFSKNKILCNARISKDTEPSVECFLFSENKKDKFFSPIYKKIEKNTCIFYINILGSKDEENYIFINSNYI